MLARGMDPKPMVLDFCKPQCIYWKEKLERCEAKLEIVIKTNPTKTCLYPMRDWVTCVEACVSCCSLRAHRPSRVGPAQGPQLAGGYPELLQQDPLSRVLLSERGVPPPAARLMRSGVKKL